MGFLAETDEQNKNNKSSCRPGWLLKAKRAGTVRWTSEIRDNGKLYSERIDGEKTCRMVIVL